MSSTKEVLMMKILSQHIPCFFVVLFRLLLTWLHHMKINRLCKIQPSELSTIVVVKFIYM